MGAGAVSDERDNRTGGMEPVAKYTKGSIAAWVYADGKLRMFKSHTPSEFIVIEPADLSDFGRLAAFAAERWKIES
jgi:hypothetical protein